MQTVGKARDCRGRTLFGSLAALLSMLALSASADAAGSCLVFNYDGVGNRTEHAVASTSAAPTWGATTWGCFLWTP